MRKKSFQFGKYICSQTHRTLLACYHSDVASILSLTTHSSFANTNQKKKTKKKINLETKCKESLPNTPFQSGRCDFLFHAALVRVLYTIDKQTLFVHSLMNLFSFFLSFFLSFFHSFVLLLAGKRRLEICRNGIGSFIFMAVHNSRCRWNSWHYFTSANIIRYPCTD